MIELDLRTRFTIEVEKDSHWGACNFAARANKLIIDALRADGFSFKANPGGAIDPLCTTDVFRMEYVEATTTASPSFTREGTEADLSQRRLSDR